MLTILYLKHSTVITVALVNITSHCYAFKSGEISSALNKTLIILFLIFLRSPVEVLRGSLDSTLHGRAVNPLRTSQPTDS